MKVHNKIEKQSISGDQFFQKLITSPKHQRLHPQIANVFRTYLQGEKICPHGDQWIINTHLPPYPGRSFDTMIQQMTGLEKKLFSVTVAVTNRCPMKCWHCYNAGRSHQDISLDDYKKLAQDLQNAGAVMVTLTGGEPLLRDDLEEICACFDDRSTLIIGTTGKGLTQERAQRLKDMGVFGLGISLDNVSEKIHNNLRGSKTAFNDALNGIAQAQAVGLYPYLVAVGTREFLEPDHFHAYMDFAQSIGAKEVHLLEPCASGRLSGQYEVLLNQEEKKLILHYQEEFSKRLDTPILSTFTYLESAEAFGCGAGLTHLYIDGSGELSPCNLVPLSFGNISQEGLDECLSRMSEYFKEPRSTCLGKCLTHHVDFNGPVPTPYETSKKLCDQYLEKEHELPLFFKVRKHFAHACTAQDKLQHTYDEIHPFYDDFWTIQAHKPTYALIEKLQLQGNEHIFEAGGGTGIATEALARIIANQEEGYLLTLDISQEMQTIAQKRLTQANLLHKVTFHQNDALKKLTECSHLDLIFSSWVLGYIPLKEFFEHSLTALRPNGRLAFIVHTQNSPLREWTIFMNIIARYPSVLLNHIVFDFPESTESLSLLLSESGFSSWEIEEEDLAFPYNTPEEVLEHLLKSGAGTVFYQSIHPNKREELTREFLNQLEQQRDSDGTLTVKHRYLSCIAYK